MNPSQVEDLSPVGRCPKQYFYARMHAKREPDSKEPLPLRFHAMQSTLRPKNTTSDSISLILEVLYRFITLRYEST